MPRAGPSPLPARGRRMHPQQLPQHPAQPTPSTQPRPPPPRPRPPPPRRASTDSARRTSPEHSSRQLVRVLQNHNHHLTVVATSRPAANSSSSITPAQSVRSTIPPAPCCFDQPSAMAPKPAAHRAHRANSVYSTPSSARPSRHPSSMHHRFGKFSPASRRAFHALFSRRLRTRSPDANQTTVSTDPGARVTEERLKVLTDENARLRARVVELMSRILCGTTEDGLATVDLNGEGVRNPGDLLRAEAGSESRLHDSILATGISAPAAVRFSATDSNEVSPPPSRAPSDGVTPAPVAATLESRMRAEAEALRASLDHAAKENERLKKCLTELQERSQREVRTIEEEKEELEEKLCAAREDREVMENELTELRDWSKRNIARKEAIIETVKKEFEDTREEVNLLNELLETMRKDQSTQASSSDNADSAERQLTSDSAVQADDVVEEDIVVPSETGSAEGNVAAASTEEEAPAEEETSPSVGAGSSSTSASVPLSEDEKATPEQNRAPSVEDVPPPPKEVETPPKAESSSEEGDVNEEEKKISPTPKAVPDRSGQEKRGRRASTVQIAPKKNQGAEADGGSDDSKDSEEKRYREAELSNPLMNVEREQIIVGHFCGHVVQTVTQMVGKGHEARIKEGQVKRLIAQQWEQWVAGTITKVELIDTLVDWVQNCCSKGPDTDVVESFNSWYVAQYTQYKHRASPDHMNAENGGKMRRMLSKAEAKSSGQSSEGGSNGDGSMARRLVEAATASAGEGGSLDKLRVNRSNRDVGSRRGSRHVQDEGGTVVRRSSEVKPEPVTEGDGEEVVDATMEALSSAAKRLEVDATREDQP